MVRGIIIMMMIKGDGFIPKRYKKEEKEREREGGFVLYQNQSVKYPISLLEGVCT